MTEISLEPPRKRSRATCCCMGCAALLLIAAITLSLLFFAGFRFIKNFEINDPETRASRVYEFLGTDQLPDGYYPVGAINVPLLFKMGVISDQPPTAGGAIEVGNKSFVVVKTNRWMSLSEDDRDGLLSLAGIQLENKEELDQGTVLLVGGTAEWTAYRGDLQGVGLPSIGTSIPQDWDPPQNRDASQESEPQGNTPQTDLPEAENAAPLPGLFSVISIECTESPQPMIGLWLTRYPSPDTILTPTESTDSTDSTTQLTATDLTGSPADAGAIDEFLNRFQFCSI